MESKLPSEFIFSVTVWGDIYTTLFLTISLPSQLSKYNLPALHSKSIYQIYTTKEDADRIQKSKVFKKLKSIMTIEFYYILNTFDLIPYSKMSDCHRRAIYQADRKNAALFILPPDCIFSDGTLTRAESLILMGYRVVSISGVRLAQEMIVPLLLEDYINGEKTELNISSRDLIKIALDYLHPICLKQIWNDRAYYQDMIPYNLFWKIKNEGLLGRCFCLHPLVVFPKNKHAEFLVTTDQDYIINACPDMSEHYIVTNSDDMLMFEITTLSRNPKGISGCDLNDIIKFAKEVLNPIHYINAYGYIHFHAGLQTTKLWDNAKEESDALMSKVFEGLKIGEKSYC